MSSATENDATATVGALPLVVTPETKAEAEKIFSDVIKGFNHCLTDYKALTGKAFIGRFLDMDQTIKVGDMETVQNVQSRSSMDGVAMCPLNGELTIIHAFQTAGKTVPIPKTKYRVYLIEEGRFFDSENFVSDGILDDNGKAVLKLKPGQKYKVIFYPNVTENDLKRLYKSYDGLLATCSAWLTKKWENGQRAEWEEFITNGATIDIAKVMEEFVDGVWDALKSIWDLVCKLFDILCNPVKYAKKLAELIPNPQQLIDMYDSKKDDIAETLMMLKDEALLFICFNAAWCYIRLLTPQQIADFISKQLAAILTEVIISIVLPGAILKKGFDGLMNFA